MLPTNPLLNAIAPAGPHLPVALLRQYVAGTLAAAAQHRVEAHTLACSRCADVLQGLLQAPPATTDQALVQLQQRLRQRLRQRVQQAAPARQMPALRQHRWLVPQLAAAAALLLGLVAGGWWAWQQRHLAHTSAPPVMTGLTRPAALGADSAQQSSTKAPTTAGPVATLSAPHPQAQPNHKAPAGPRHQPAAKHSAHPSPKGEAATSMPPSGPANAARVRATAMPAATGLVPIPVGGTAVLREKLRREAAEFVPEASARALSGTVRLRVIIGVDGKVKKINVLRGLRADYDAEAQRLVREGPAWVPGTSGGRRAAQVVDVAVPF